MEGISSKSWVTILPDTHLWIHRLREWHHLTLGRLHRRYLQVVCEVELRNSLETFAEVRLHSAGLPCLQVRGSAQRLDTKRYGMPGSSVHGAVASWISIMLPQATWFCLSSMQAKQIQQTKPSSSNQEVIHEKWHGVDDRCA